MLSVNISLKRMILLEDTASKKCQYIVSYQVVSNFYGQQSLGPVLAGIAHSLIIHDP